ncbi:hypothetical protein [Bacillus cereus]|uniref:hypothetical protein n=1 Tax=Bacillus cereus TaxID=1396 RepID=UPI000B4B259A|nr:hypothetical protein [Bacillus cereus]
MKFVKKTINIAVPFLLFSSLLVGCSLTKEKVELISDNDANTTDKVAKMTDENIEKIYKEKMNNKEETVTRTIHLEMDPKYDGKEFFVLSNTEKETYFRVFHFDEDKKTFKKLFEEKSTFEKDAPYYVQGIYPFNPNETNHILIGKINNPHMVFTYFLFGKTLKTNKIEVLVDNAIGKDVMGVFEGDAGYVEGRLNIYSGLKTVKSYITNDEGWIEF